RFWIISNFRHGLQLEPDISFQETHQVIKTLFFEKRTKRGTISETPHRSSRARNLFTFLQRMVDINKLLPLFYFCVAAAGQTLCQRNERYVECGKCEATCTNPNTECQHGCLSSRCECVAALNYVRDRHGACIKITDCDVPTVLITFESSNAFRKIFGKLYNEAKIAHGTHSGSTEMSRPQPPEATEVHSYPPEHFREPVTRHPLETLRIPIIRSYPPENTPEDVHSYPPENTPEDVHSYPPETSPEDVHSYITENTPEDYPSENFREHVIQRYPFETHATVAHSYPPENVPEAVHSHPPEGPEETVEHTIPVRHPSNRMDIHSYPPEDRFRKIPAHRYVRHIPEHPPSARDIRSYSRDDTDDTDEKAGVVTYKPEFPDQTTTPDNLSLPFVSEYGIIASHQSGTFYAYHGTKEESTTQRYDPYDPRRFEEAKVVSKLSKSSFLPQVPRESMTLRDIGGKSSLQDLAGAMILSDFHPHSTVEGVNESQVISNTEGRPSSDTWTTPPITLQNTTALPGITGKTNIPMETHGTLQMTPTEPSTMTDVHTMSTDAAPSGGATNYTGNPGVSYRTAPSAESPKNLEPVTVESSAIPLNTNVVISAEVPNTISKSATTPTTASQRGVAPRVENPSAPFSTITHEARTPHEVAISTTTAEQPRTPYVETLHSMLNTTSRETATTAKNRSEGRTQLNTQHTPAHNEAIITTITIVKAEMKSPVISREGNNTDRLIPNLQVSLDTPQGKVFYQKPLRHRRRLKK
ncbi:hypothetical protein GCK32_007291, partial [Trichostrongylus colubriformis]